MYKDQIFLIIGDLIIYWHGIIIALALAAGIFLAYRIRKAQSNGDSCDVLIISFFTLLFAFVGARGFYCWCFPDKFPTLSDALKFGNGGYAMLGAIAGAFIGTIIGALILRTNVAEILDVFAPASALTISIGRWAAALTGENLGGVVETEWLQGMPYAMYSSNENMYRKAFFVYESIIALFMTAIFLWLFISKYINRSINFRRGDLYMLFIVSYFSIQGIFESSRYDILYFNTPYIPKLQTVSASFCLGGLMAALPLAIMILRNIFTNGIKGNTLWHIPACAVLYFGYFNIILRIDASKEIYNHLLLIICAFGLVGVAIDLFLTPIPVSKKRDIQPTASLQGRNIYARNPR